MFQFQDTTIINLDKIFIDKISQIRKKVIKINVKIVENIQMNCFQSSLIGDWSRFESIVSVLWEDFDGLTGTWVK